MPTPRDGSGFRGAACCGPTPERRELLGPSSAERRALVGGVDVALADVVRAQHGLLQDWTVQWEQRSREQLDGHLSAITELMRELKFDLIAAPPSGAAAASGDDAAGRGVGDLLPLPPSAAASSSAPPLAATSTGTGGAGSGEEDDEGWESPLLAEKVAELKAIDSSLARDLALPALPAAPAAGGTMPMPLGDRAPRGPVAPPDIRGLGADDAAVPTKPPPAPRDKEDTAVIKGVEEVKLTGLEAVRAHRVSSDEGSRAMGSMACDSMQDGAWTDMRPKLHLTETPVITKALEAPRQVQAEAILKQATDRQRRISVFRARCSAPSESPVVRLVNGPVFKAISATAIIANTVFTGVQVDTNARLAFRVPMESLPDYFKVGDLIFQIVFTVELVLRIAAYRMEYFLGEEWRWNLFDFVLVTSQYLEGLLSGSIDMSAIRVIRITRLVRTLRIIKVVPFFGKLRMMVCCIYNSLMSLMWSLVLLFLLMYLFSITCMQATISFQRGDMAEEESPLRGDDMPAAELRDALELHFRSLPRALLAMLMTITGGMDWYDVVQPLMAIHWAYSLAFALYICFVIFGVLNVLSAVFVENALEIRDRDLLIQSQMDEMHDFARDMAELFNEADNNKNGYLTESELAEYLRDERVMAYMSGYDLDISDFDTMYQLMDEDSSGKVEMNAFVLAMMRLKGKARCLDLMRVFQCLDELQRHIRDMQLLLSLSPRSDSKKAAQRGSVQLRSNTPPDVASGSAAAKALRSNTSPDLTSNLAVKAKAAPPPPRRTSKGW